VPIAVGARRSRKAWEVWGSLTLATFTTILPIVGEMVTRMGRCVRGQFQHAVLLAIMRPEPQAYGVPVQRDLSNRLCRTVSVGAVYITLERLEDKGFISSWTGGATAKRGGRTKRFYQIEAPGLRALDDARAVTENL
jgi:PadR family transcriptional regulator